jgi:hypothetical protein
VAKDSKDSGDSAFAMIAIDGVLVRKEFNNRLSYAHLASGHNYFRLPNFSLV